jgi:ketol-acid reductoisomerase
MSLGILGIRIIDAYNDFINIQQKNKKNNIVVGYGWAGKSFCKNIDHNKFNIPVISKSTFMSNTPAIKESIIKYK